MLRKLFTPILMVFSFTSFGQTKTTKANRHSITNAVMAIDTSVIAVLPYSKEYYWMFKNCKQARLSDNDIEKSERLLAKCIDDYNKIRENRFIKDSIEHPEYKLDKKDCLIDLTTYKRQYVAVINSKGQKEVFINCFCQTDGLEWRNVILINDGPVNCFFRLKINLTTGKHYDWVMNRVV